MNTTRKLKNAKKVLNVGGNDKLIPIPPCFDGWQHDILDIDPSVSPDILCDARELWKLPPRQYDAIYCSHNLEHYYFHEVPNVLKGFKLLLKRDGFVYIVVPNIINTVKKLIDENMDLDDTLYVSPAGPIAAIDVIFGLRKQIQESGDDYFAHKCGFSETLLKKLLITHGFKCIISVVDDLNITAYGFYDEPSNKMLESLDLNEAGMS